MKTGQVFVSHTSDAARFPVGRSFAQAALDAVARAGMAPVDMRYFAARDDRPADYCRARVRECEVYVAVIGFRYGSLVPGEAVSYTELEFREACIAGLPRLVFLLDDAASLPGALVDADPGPVERFRQQLRDAGLVVRAFTSEDNLELEVFHALNDLVDHREMRVNVASPSRPSVHTLPPVTDAFTGRDRELQALLGNTTNNTALTNIVAISAIDGMAGIGKTTFALQAARMLGRYFPDGQLFINLHGHTSGVQPSQPGHVLSTLLSAIGVAPNHIPAHGSGVLT